MREFFRGWRQKAGVVALLAAIAVTAIWVRSLLFAEGYLRFGENQNLSILSTTGAVRWQWSPSRPSVNPFDHHVWHSGSPEQITIQDAAYDFDRFGFMIRRYNRAWAFGSFPIVEFIIPYWLLAIPLTLLSAVLILWPQRKKPSGAENSKISSN